MRVAIIRKSWQICTWAAFGQDEGGWKGKHADGTGRLLFVYVDGKDADLDPVLYVLSMGELAAVLRAWMWCPTREAGDRS